MLALITIHQLLRWRAFDAWWLMMGKERYPDATLLMITADSGGSNGARVRLWKAELQKFANEIGLEISREPLPAGNQ